LVREQTHRPEGRGAEHTEQRRFRQIADVDVVDEFGDDADEKHGPAGKRIFSGLK